ncbi:integrase core domain-containing protein [Ochrobactrum sp. SSR]|uniref:integrase core domain-containing protein n=1 Tax=Ochrobactrum sp. SSR TaxID=3045176 RepID=UPI0035302A10
MNSSDQRRRSCRGAPSRRSATASIIWKLLVPVLGADIEAHSSSLCPLPISDRSPLPPDGVCLPLTLENWRRHYNEDRPHSAIGYNVPIALHNPDGVISPPLA